MYKNIISQICLRWISQSFEWQPWMLFICITYTYNLQGGSLYLRCCVVYMPNTVLQAVTVVELVWMSEWVTSPATSSGSAWPNTVNASHLLSEAFMTSSLGQTLSLTSPMLLCHTVAQSAVFTTKATHIVHLLLSSNGFWQNPDSTTFAWLLFADL